MAAVYCAHPTPKGSRRVRCSRCRRLGCHRCRDEDSLICRECGGVTEHRSMGNPIYDYERETEFTREDGETFRRGDRVKVKLPGYKGSRFRVRAKVVKRLIDESTRLYPDGRKPRAHDEYVECLGLKPKRRAGKVHRFALDAIER